jgi:hypothetical protein
MRNKKWPLANKGHEDNETNTYQTQETTKALTSLEQTPHTHCTRDHQTNSPTMPPP